MSKTIKYEVVAVTIPDSGSASGEINLTIPGGYTPVAAMLARSGATPVDSTRVSLQNATGEGLPLVNYKALDVSNAVAPADRFLPLNVVKAPREDLVMTVSPGGTQAGAVRFEFIVRFEKEA